MQYILLHQSLLKQKIRPRYSKNPFLFFYKCIFIKWLLMLFFFVYVHQPFTQPVPFYFEKYELGTYQGPILYFHTGEFTKRVRDMPSQLFVTLFTLYIYPSLYTQTAVTTSPESFSQIPLYYIHEYISFMKFSIM